MGMVKLLVHLPAPLKAKLDGLRAQGTTRSHRVAVLVRQRLADLGNVVQVVNGPGGQEMPQRDRSELRVGALPVKLPP